MSTCTSPAGRATSARRSAAAGESSSFVAAPPARRNSPRGAGGSSRGGRLRPLCSQAASAIARQCSLLRAAWAASSRTTLRSVSKRGEGRDAELGGLLHHQVHALAARDALRERERERRLALGAACLAHRHGDGVLGDPGDRGGELPAGAIKESEAVPGAQPQHAADVRRRAPREGHLRAAPERGFHEHPAQSHVASPIPSRATSTMRSISSGVITYGGMK